MDCDFSHDPAAVPRLIAAAENGADLVLGSRYVPGGSIPHWGAAAALHLARREHLRAGLARKPAPRPDRRLQVLPARACWRRSTSSAISAKRLRVPDRDHLPRRQGRLQGGRGADRVHRPRARPLEDEPERSCSRRSGRCRSCGSVPRAAGCSLERMRDVTDASFEQDVLRAERPVVVDFWAPWCGPVQGRDAGARGARRRDREVEFVKLDIDDNPARRVALRACSRSRR